MFKLHTAKIFFQGGIPLDFHGLTHRVIFALLPYDGKAVCCIATDHNHTSKLAQCSLGSKFSTLHLKSMLPYLLAQTLEPPHFHLQSPDCFLGGGGSTSAAQTHDAPNHSVQ